MPVIDPDVARFAAVRRLRVPLRLEGRRVASETTIADPGAWTVCFATTLPDPSAPVELHSTYQGAPGAPTFATHLFLGPQAGAARATCAKHEHASLPVFHSHRHLLVDHLLVLVDHASDARLAVTVGGLDAALAGLDV